MAGLLAGIAAGTRSSLWAVGTRASEPSESQCTLREAGRERLALEGGREFYVSPDVAEFNRQGDLLLLGYRTLLFENVTIENWQEPVTDSLFGAVVSGSGERLPVERPVQVGRMGHVAAAARADGAWDVFFSEVSSDTTFRSSEMVRLWYAVLDGAEWRSVESVPLPDEGVLHADGIPSRVIWYGDTLAWAVPLRAPGLRHDFAVLRRVHGEWSITVVPTNNAGYVDLLHVPGEGLSMAVVQPDMSLTSDAHSLFLWEERGDWKPVTRLVESRVEDVYFPRFTRTSSGLSLIWWSRSEEVEGFQLRSLSWPPSEILHPRTITTGLTVRTRSGPWEIAPGTHLWALSEADAAARRETVLLLIEAEDAARETLRLPSPFLTQFTAAFDGRNTVVVAGAHLDEERQTASSLMLRFTTSCVATGRD